MNKLSETWFAEGYIDFELKKYTLLAYLQQVDQSFGEQKLYPQLSDIIFHYNNLVAFRENKKYLQEQFPRKLTGVELENLQFLYEQMIEDSELMKELEEIIQFSVTRMRESISCGTSLFEFIEDKIEISPVGIIPLEAGEGYFFLSQGGARDTRVYRYHLSFFEKHDERFRTIRTSYVDRVYRSITLSYEQIKYDLIRSRKDMAHPAVYSIVTPLEFPVEETLLPIAKRSLARYISTPQV